MSFAPVYDEGSHILILGTYPSPKSREMQFYYGHPQNRFWKLMAALTESPNPQTIDEKKAMLLKNNIAIWDVCDSCSIEGAADATITDVIPNDIPSLLAKTNISFICCNGAKAYELLQKYHPGIPIPVYKLPSTSPANAQFGMERLMGAWSIIRQPVSSHPQDTAHQ